MPISAKQTRVYGGGVRGMTIPTGIGLKFTLTPVNPPQRLTIIALNFSTYVIFYKIRSCREPSKQFVQAPIAYKYIKIFFYWEAFEYLLRVLWFSERSEACRPSWIVWDGRLMTDEWHLINHWYFTITFTGLHYRRLIGPVFVKIMITWKCNQARNKTGCGKPTRRLSTVMVRCV